MKRPIPRIFRHHIIRRTPPAAGHLIFVEATQRGHDFTLPPAVHTDYRGLNGIG